MMPTLSNEIQSYLDTGHHDPSHTNWPGENFVAQAQAADSAFREALVGAVKAKARDGTFPEDLPVPQDMIAFTRAKVGPMVRGLFSASEQQTVLSVLERSVVLLTPTNIEGLLRETEWLSTAWDLANLYLGSLGSELLGPDAPQIVGLSEATTCFVSVEYFAEPERFGDFIVHEAAHVFHNCKRRAIGLQETRAREWLLDIEFRKRETFAYACEAYSRLLELGKNAGDRAECIRELMRGPLPSEELLDREEYIDILREAIAARNGWKRILARCAPKRPR